MEVFVAIGYWIMLYCAARAVWAVIDLYLN